MIPFRRLPGLHRTGLAAAGGLASPLRLNLIDAEKYQSGDLMIRYARVS